MQDLRGKTALVTGGGEGIGKAVALALASRGMDIAIADIEAGPAQLTADAVKGLGRSAIALSCDVSNREAVAAMADRVHAEFGAVDVLCNNAGVVASKPVEAMNAGDWDWVMGVDLYGVIYGIQAFLPRMIDRGKGGHVVNTASITGLVPAAAPGIVSYTAAKHGVVGLSEALREHLRPYCIGVSVLCPGVVTTRIGEAARNRPDRFAATTAAPAQQRPTQGAPARIVGGAPVAPGVIAERVLQAILRDEFYVLTHPETEEAVEEGFAALLASYDWLAEAVQGKGTITQ